MSLRGTVIRKLTLFANRAMAVARLTSLNLFILLSGMASTPGRQDHSAPVSTSSAWKAMCTTAAVSFAADVEVIVSTLVRSSRMEGPASPDLLQHSWELSLSIPQCDMSSPGPAAITFAPPAYVLFQFDDPFDAVDTLSTSPVFTLHSDRAAGVVGYSASYYEYAISGFPFAGTAGFAAHLGAAVTISGSDDCG